MILTDHQPLQFAGAQNIESHRVDSDPHVHPS
jgi:hypothetical protein